MISEVDLVQLVDVIQLIFKFPEEYVALRL